MKSDYFEKRMRVFETTNDPKILPHMFVIARIDGRNFSTLTREKLKLDPFDTQMAICMEETVKHLMDCGFKTMFTFTQSDEISMLFDPDIAETFAGKIRKFNSILAGEASAKFSMKMGTHATFDCRIIQLPTWEFVIDYFKWRVADSLRNALNQLCYHVLLKEGLNGTQAQRVLTEKTIQWKNDFLFTKHRINFNELEHWKKRGRGYYWKNYWKDAMDLKREVPVKVKRRMIAPTRIPENNDNYELMLSKIYEENQLEKMQRQQKKRNDKITDKYLGKLVKFYNENPVI